MNELEGQEKTEKPSERKLKEEREKGQVAKSVEINSLFIFSTGLFLVFMTQQFVSGNVFLLTRQIYGSLDVLDINTYTLRYFSAKGIFFYLYTIAPILIGLTVIGLAVNFAQVGFKLSSKAIQPKLKRFNIINGIKRIFFSSRSFAEVLKAIIKMIVIGLAVYIVISDLILKATLLVELTVPEILMFIVDSSYSLLWKIVLVFAVLAAMDFAFQKYKFNKDMMMTKQEVKDDNKQTEGDPLIKSRIRKAQYDAVKRRSMLDVPNADVVITNPTHYAVALKYDIKKDNAPKVISKGVDLMAQRIKKIAEENNVPLHEDVELARALYKSCNIGDIIPGDLYKSVAKVLAYIYQLKNDKMKSVV